MTDENREEIEQEIRNLTSQLQSSVSDVGDWKVSKCYEYVLAGKDAPYDMEELHEARQAIRDQINELQEQLDSD